MERSAMNGMYQAYKGHFKSGRFVAAEPVSIPDNTEVYVMVVGEDIPSIKTKSQRDQEAMDEFLAAIRAVDDEPITDEMIADLERNRVNIGRELDL